MESRKTAIAGRRILVTGGAGFLGRAVARKLRERGAAELTIPRRAECDLSRAEDAERLFRSARPELVVHLAASVEFPAGRGQVAESFRNNVMMALHLLESSARAAVEKVVLLGSASSYPSGAAIPLRESDLLNGVPESPRLIHGMAKRLPLVAAQAWRQEYGLRSIFLVPTNCYGPEDNFDPESSYVIPSLVRKFVEAADTQAEEVVIRGTGCATRDFLHVEDCAEGVVLALERYDGSQPVNLATGTETSIHDLARRLARLAGFTGRIRWEANYPEGPVRRVLDATRAEREFGFRAKRSLQDGLAETVAWFRRTRGEPAPSGGSRAIASRA
jgi:GDP-L-fucose synthase